ncbi:MAG: GspE/PulE family protein [Myxococcota bacterium]|nr:GspE/PulE family protein [Myxococcota bacterium]
MTSPRSSAGRPGAVQREGQRPALTLDELLDLMVKHNIATPEATNDVASRATTLKSMVLKERVGSVRSQAASRYDVTPAEIVVAAKLPHPKQPKAFLDEDAIAQLLAHGSGVPYHKIDPLRIDNQLVAKTLSRPFARHHVVIPLSRDTDGLKIALIDPYDTGLRGELEGFLHEPLQYAVAAKKDILAVIDRVYGFRSSVKQADEEIGPGQRSGKLVQMVEVKSADELTNTDEHVIAAVDYLLNYAYEQRASDIHLEPRQDDAIIRFRIDGILHEIETVPYGVHGAITSRVKVMAGMNIAERRRPQDGRIKTQRADREVELRVSSMMTAFGEKIVIRVFDPTVLMQEVQELGLSPGERDLYERWITSPNGLILVTGPTGSGKTTTLYSTLRYLSGPEINITTVEDPIELIDPRFCQVQVQPQIDVTFSTALRTIMRQDPDIIMVGEIRDGETAQMAVQAALTGHLVFSTVHTRNASGAVTRLIELGVEPFLLSSVLRGVVAQRLIRRICERCAVEGTLNAEQVQALGLKVPVERRESLRVRWGEGCIDCRHTGLFGRTGVFEMLDVGRRIRTLVNEGKDANEIANAGRIEGMEPLRDAAVRKLAEGTTTFEEVVRLTADVE